MPQVLDIGRLIDDAPVSALQRRIVALCSVATFLDGYDVQALGVAVPRMAESLRVSPTVFAAALSGSLIGMAVGAIALAPLGDRLGQRPTLIALMVLIGLSTLGVMVSSSIQLLTVWRVLTGLGIGGAVPVAVAITSEFSPTRRRAGLITVMIACMALGSFAAGMAAPLLDHWLGWPGIFAPAALLPLLLVGLLWLWLPESPRFLLRKGGSDPALRRTLERITPGLGEVTLTDRALSAPVRASVGALFAPTLWLRTLLLWSIFWFNLFAIYSLISWLPTLLRQSGWTHGDAQRAAGLLALGGIAGGLIISWLADRGRGIAALFAAYLGTAVLLFLFLNGPGDAATWTPLLTLVGVLGLGAQMALVSIAAAHYYPSELRSTGVGWYSGVSRVGAIAGPLVLAVLMNAGWTSGAILGFLMAPMLICAACVLLLPRALRTQEY